MVTYSNCYYPRRPVCSFKLTGVNGNEIIVLESKRATTIPSKKDLQIGKGWSKLPIELGKIADLEENH